MGRGGGRRHEGAYRTLGASQMRMAGLPLRHGLSSDLELEKGFDDWWWRNGLTLSASGLAALGWFQSQYRGQHGPYHR